MLQSLCFSWWMEWTVLATSARLRWWRKWHCRPEAPATIPPLGVTRAKMPTGTLSLWRSRITTSSLRRRSERWVLSSSSFFFLFSAKTLAATAAAANFYPGRESMFICKINKPNFYTLSLYILPWKVLSLSLSDLPLFASGVTVYYTTLSDMINRANYYSPKM